MQYSRLREALADYMITADDPERVYPPDRLVVDVMDAATGATEEQVIRCLLEGGARAPGGHKARAAQLRLVQDRGSRLFPAEAVSGDGLFAGAFKRRRQAEQEGARFHDRRCRVTELR